MNKYNLNTNTMQEIRKSINYLNQFILPTTGNTQLGGGMSLKFKSFESGKPYMTFTDGNKDFNIQLQDLFNSSMQGGADDDSDTLSFSNFNSMKGGNKYNTISVSSFNMRGGNQSDTISVSSFNMKGGDQNAIESESLDLSIFNKYGGANIKNFDATSSAMESIMQQGGEFYATSPMQQGGEFSATSDAMNSVLKGGSRKRLDFSATSSMQQGGEFSATSSMQQMGGNIFKKTNNNELSTLDELSEIKNRYSMKGGAKYNSWKQNMQQLGINSSSTDFCD